MQAQERAARREAGDAYEAYERRIEEATAPTETHARGGGQSGGDGDDARKDDARQTRHATASPATAEDAALTWERLSAHLGRGARVAGERGGERLRSPGSRLRGVRDAGGHCRQRHLSSVSSLASLETLGLAAKPKGHFDATRARKSRRFSHLARRGGASAAAFGGADIDDGDLSGPRAA